MKNKKRIHRFTLQFDPTNALHSEAIAILNSLGRKKSDYIAKLIYDSKAKEINQSHKQDKELERKNVKNQIVSQDYKNEILKGLQYF